MGSNPENNNMERIAIAFCLMILGSTARGQTPPLDRQLDAEDPIALARDARQNGDPARGALIYYRPQLACVTCHGQGQNLAQLGPDLSKVGKEVTDQHLIESILHPSKVIKPEFQAVTIATLDGSTTTGLVVEDKKDTLTLRDGANPANVHVITKAQIEERRQSRESLMPVGLVNALANHDEFRDLLSYLRAIADGGPARALALRPDPAQLAPKPLPAYEHEIDHAGLIARLGAKSLERGEAIYVQICASCHGTKESVGSMPTSLRFSLGKFKNGSDPYRLYQTLTHGYAQMAAQVNLVPRQKYDVIHYIRERMLKSDNLDEYVKVDQSYLASLPKGTQIGPEPVVHQPWLDMDYGNVLQGTFQVSEEGPNIAIKGIAVRLDPGPGGVAKGNAWMVYDHDTMRMVGAWTGKGFIDWAGINFDGRHESHPRVVGRVHASTPDLPGWAYPSDRTRPDARIRGRDGRLYGPLPHDWVRYEALEPSGLEPTIKYSVGGVSIVEVPGLTYDKDQPNLPIFVRRLTIELPTRELEMRVCADTPKISVAVSDPKIQVIRRDGLVTAIIPKSDARLDFHISISDRATGHPLPVGYTPTSGDNGGEPKISPLLRTVIRRGRDDGPFAVDILTAPEGNPWKSQLRFSGLDFFGDGRSMAICTWDGDVWIVKGLSEIDGQLIWKRFAQGLFQPLGLKIVQESVYVCCRDQIVKLEDKNYDGVADSYVCFNTDHIITESFHEFAMDLQTDRDGNFYYAKGARHGKPPIVPHHGTLLKVAKDGSSTEIIATGFRAPNGVSVNEDGTFLMTDQEGHWMPKNRINWVKPGKFYGNMWGFHDIKETTDSAMEQPIVWITNAFDRSPSQIVAIEDKNWGVLDGRRLSLSYGYGKVFLLMDEMVSGIRQGGLVELPIDQFPTGVMRARFNPSFGDMYACGLFGWAGNQVQPGGLYRVRRTGKPLLMPTYMATEKHSIILGYNDVLDRASATDASHYAITAWSLKRSANYGSKHYDERLMTVQAVHLSEDGKTVRLDILDLIPTQGLEIRYQVMTSVGTPVEGKIHSTIHALGP